MKALHYQLLKELGYTGYVLEQAPEKVLQFGEGNFLRAFATTGLIWPTSGWGGMENVYWSSPFPRERPRRSTPNKGYIPCACGGGRTDGLWTGGG